MLNHTMPIHSTPQQAFKWSMWIGLGLAIVQFLSNWLGLIHQNDSPTAYQLFDISFYYFTPMLSWTMLTIGSIRLAKRGLLSQGFLRKNVILILVAVLLLSPLVRMFDILVDYSLKNVLGMVRSSPFKILNDVWLVVLFSTPTAAFKILVILAITYVFHRKDSNALTLTVRSGSGMYHMIEWASICYLQSEGNYLMVHTMDESYRIRMTLKSLEARLGEEFHRIHKSTIINRQHIKQLKHWRNGEYLVIMSDDKPLTSSKTYKAAIDQIKGRMAANNPAAGNPKSATVRPTIA